MLIKQARAITGFEKCTYENGYSDRCTCGEKMTRWNSENYLKTSFEYDEYEYACNKCVVSMAKYEVDYE